MPIVRPAALSARPCRAATRRLSAGLLAAVLSAGAPRAVHADPPRTEASGVSPADSEEYRALVDGALREYGLGHFDVALARFREAHAMKPSARTHRGIGLAECELGRYPECTMELEAALAAEERPLTGQVRAATEEALARAARHVGRVSVTRSPSAAFLWVDGAPVVLGEGQPLLLGEGEHVVEARAPGYAPAARPVSVDGGATLHVELALTPLPAATASQRPAAAELPRAPRAAPRPRWYERPWVWAAMGAAVAGAAVTTGVLVAH